MIAQWILVLLLVVQSPALAGGSDRVGAPPHALIFGSQYGSHGFQLCVTYKDARMDSIRGKLFTYDRDGAEKVVWKRELEYLPRRVLVSDFGPVIALNRWGSVGFEHALVVFGPSGEVLADYKLEDLLNAREIRQHHKTWDFYSATKFTRKAFSMKLTWGKEIKIDLATGRLLTD